jgi:hypothetical protein
MARILRGSNEELFDRYINIRLCREKPVAAGEFSIFSKASISSALDAAKKLMTINDLDFQIVCPRAGLKPNITVSGQWNIENTVNSVTVTVYNMDANIDTMAYNYIQVDVGYYNSGIHVSFMGQITNCYMAKPNPNGELVINAVMAPVDNLYAQGDFEVTFPTDIVTTPALISYCVDAMKKKHPEVAPYMMNATQSLDVLDENGWFYQRFTVGRGTKHFRSCMDCITWLNSLFATFTLNTGFASGPGGIPTTATFLEKRLPPLKLGFDETGNLTCLEAYSEGTPMSVKALYAIGSAFLTSTQSATVTAPFNPGILPGEIVFIDSRYFKTRINLDKVRDAYKSMGNLWYVIQTQFTFSTHTTNTMTLLLNNVRNSINASEG